MTSLLKLLLLFTALTTIGLCFTVSSAAIDSSSTSDHHATTVYIFPLLESEGKSNNFTDSNLIISIRSASLEGSTSIGDLLNIPLLIIPNDVLPRPKMPKKNHSFFEFSALFNDKLQSFIAYFHDAKKVDHADKLADISSVFPKNCNS
tara:strand:+ start:162 stop:605 length:444 start_codon:yes stop_codon:yes gene_type:complete